MHTALIVWILLGLLFGFSHNARAADAPARRLAENNNAFAIDLYHRLDTQGKNAFFSPYSISSAFAMCYAGAGGDTKREMSDVFHFPKDRGLLHNGFRELNDALEQVQEKGHVELRIANSLWAQHDHPFLPGYLSITDESYDAEAENVDFEHHTEAARKEINAWTEEKTNHRIRDVIPPGVLSPESRLVLASAIYFKGEWSSTFDRRRTKDEPFWVTAQAAKDVPMMRQTGHFAYAEDKDVQLLTLPYKGDDLSMVVLLPREKQGIHDLECYLTLERLHAWMDASRMQNVDVRLPRFTIDAGFSLKEPLTAMGVRDAFRWPGADFSGMDGTDLLYLSDALHKAWVQVDERGTEAAAATAVVVMVGAAPGGSVKTFRADHPFLFFIRENRTGSLLFMGKVHDPSER